MSKNGPNPFIVLKQLSYDMWRFYAKVWKIYGVMSKPPHNSKGYDITISNFLACTCLDFVLIMVGLLGK